MGIVIVAESAAQRSAGQHGMGWVGKAAQQAAAAHLSLGPE